MFFAVEMAKLEVLEWPTLSHHFHFHGLFRHTPSEGSAIALSTGSDRASEWNSAECANMAMRVNSKHK